MRKLLTINLLFACFSFAACSEHTGTVLQQSSGPDAPINEPDTNVFEPIAGGGGGTGEQAGGGAESGAGAGAGSTVDPGEPGGGSNGQGGTGGSSGEPGGGGNPGEEPTEGGNGGQPVPEPGTLLLVGSGLAGVGASLLRRRRRREQQVD